jgi:hypothetical protein
MAKIDFKIGNIYELDGIQFRLIRMRSGLVKVFQQLNPDGTDFQVCRKRPDGTFGAIVDFGVRVIHARIDEVKEVQTEQQQKLF